MEITNIQNAEDEARASEFFLQIKRRQDLVHKTFQRPDQGH